VSAVNPWVVCFHPRPGARLRLVCFPHSGGAPAAYRAWSSQLPAWLELQAVRYPGRIGAPGQAPLTHLRDLAHGAAGALTDDDPRPMAFWGHSLGAIVAYEAALLLQDRGGAGPRHLFAAAAGAPHLPLDRPAIHGLDDAGFLAEVAAYGGTPDAVMEHPELLEILLPVLRADFEAYETYRPGGALPAGCPVTVLGGEGDALVSRERLAAWAVQGGGNTPVRLYPGGHFFPQAHADDVLALVVRTLADA